MAQLAGLFSSSLRRYSRLKHFTLRPPRSNLFINLSSKLDRPLMELLARETLAEGSVDMISKIFDQNLEFVSLEHRLFSLDRPGSYVQYNDPTCPDAQVNVSFCARHGRAERSPMMKLPPAFSIRVAVLVRFRGRL